MKETIEGFICILSTFYVSAEGSPKTPNHIKRVRWLMLNIRQRLLKGNFLQFSCFLLGSADGCQSCCVSWVKWSVLTEFRVRISAGFLRLLFFFFGFSDASLILLTITRSHIVINTEKRYGRGEFSESMRTCCDICCCFSCLL